jgi:hypothetical protein
MLSLCGAPEAYHSWKRKDCGVSWGMLIMWGLGEILTLGYTIWKVYSLPLYTNYILNLFFIGVMIYYKSRKHYLGASNAKTRVPAEPGIPERRGDDFSGS